MDQLVADAHALRLLDAEAQVRHAPRARVGAEAYSARLRVGCGGSEFFSNVWAVLSTQRREVLDAARARCWVLRGAG